MALRAVVARPQPVRPRDVKTVEDAARLEAWYIEPFRQLADAAPGLDFLKTLANRMERGEEPPAHVLDRVATALEKGALLYQQAASRRVVATPLRVIARSRMPRRRRVQRSSRTRDGPSSDDPSPSSRPDVVVGRLLAEWSA
jgi:hypothetical protein